VEATLYGERHDSQKTASVSNMNAKNSTFGDLMRGICMGLVENLAKMMPNEFLSEFQDQADCGWIVH
jgi:hypothetical protein